jgi:hypothetical protein
MKKINYRLVFNRKKHLNTQGKALVQVEASLKKKENVFLHPYLKDYGKGPEELSIIFRYISFCTYATILQHIM